MEPSKADVTSMIRIRITSALGVIEKEWCATGLGWIFWDCGWYRCTLSALQWACWTSDANIYEATWQASMPRAYWHKLNVGDQLWELLWASVLEWRSGHPYQSVHNLGPHSIISCMFILACRWFDLFHHASDDFGNTSAPHLDTDWQHLGAEIGQLKAGATVSV